MRVSQSCEGCEHCEYNILDDSGCYEPGYYCDLDYCPEIEEDYNAEIDGQVRDGE